MSLTTCFLILEAIIKLFASTAPYLTVLAAITLTFAVIAQLAMSFNLMDLVLLTALALIVTNVHLLTTVANAHQLAPSITPTMSPLLFWEVAAMLALTLTAWSAQLTTSAKDVMVLSSLFLLLDNV